MLLTLLLALLALSPLLQANNARFLAAMVFAIVTLAHDLFLSWLGGSTYYVSAAVGDLLIINLLSVISPATHLAVRLQWISMASIVNNFCGWLLWITYQPPAAYDAVAAVLAMCALVVLMLRDNNDVGNSRVGGWLPGVWRNRHSRLGDTDRDES